MQARCISLFLLPLAAILLSLLLGLLSLASGSESVILAEYLPTPRPSEPCDVCEPNNSFSEACGPLAPGKSYQYFIRCTAKRDDDFYYIDLETPGTVTLDLTSIPSGPNPGIYLYDENKEPVSGCYSNQPGNLPEHVVCPNLSPGRYYVRVYPWTGCNDNDPYTLTVTYPTPAPTPTPTNTPAPLCNLHIDDFGDTNPKNDLDKPSGWEFDPPGCGTFKYTGSELQLDLTSPDECTARYTTTLSLSASPYEMLAFEIQGKDKEELVSTVIGLSDEQGREMRIKVGDFLNQVLTDTWQGGSLPLAPFATRVDTSQLDTLSVEFTDAQGASQGTVCLDSLRLERSNFPLTVDNFDDLADPNALGGGTGIYKDDNPGTILETAYIAEGTYDDSPGSYVISYTLPSGEWALWETYLLGLDVSGYAFLSFYIKGANGGEKVNLYLADGSDRAAYVDVEAYAPIATDWTPVRVPLQAFEGVALMDLSKIKFIFEWEPMTGTIFLDDLRFVADTLLIDNFCDDDENNSLNGEADTFASAPPVPPCTGTVTSALSSGVLRLDYDVTAGPDCYSGYWSRTPLDLNPYRTLAVKVRSERCGQVASISARTVPVVTGKLKLSDYLLNGITDQWQEARIPLAASSVVTDWTRGDSYVIAFEANQGASKGTTWWDDVAFETACVPLWVDNFNDEDDFNALRVWSGVFGEEITSTTSITQAYGDAGAGLCLAYTVLVDGFAGWETWLGDVDLSDYDRLVFNIKGGVGGEEPNIWLKDGHGERRFVNIETYAPLSTTWQTIVIPLEDFGDLDLTRIQYLQFIIEWEPTDVEGTFCLDNIRFLPSAGCSQITQNPVFLPMIAKGHAPLTFDPIWDFESGTEGWRTYRTITTSRATVDVVTSTFRSRWGNASLAMILNLVGGDDRFDRGVAYVDLSEPTDLACKPLSCWIYVPTCGLGDPAEPTSARLFIKDVNDKDEYGTLGPVQRNQWYKIELRPSTQKPYKGWIEPGFDPHAIIRLGVQVRTDSQETIYRGKVYVDACGWQEIDPVGAASIEACLPKHRERMPPPLPRSEE
jgi:hypothetical protein